MTTINFIICPKCHNSLKIRETKKKITIYKKCPLCKANLVKLGQRYINYYKKDSTEVNKCDLNCKYHEKWQFHAAHSCDFCLNPRFNYYENKYKCPEK